MADEDNSMTLQALITQHPEWLGHTLVIYHEDGHYDYIGAAGLVYEVDEEEEGTTGEPIFTGNKLLVFAAN
jgi:hypothetical protein